MPLMRWPFKITSPLVGAKRPLIRLNSVDLPAPLGPMMATRSPGHGQVGAADDLGLAKTLAQSRSSSAWLRCQPPWLQSLPTLDFMLDLFLSRTPLPGQTAAGTVQTTPTR